MTGAVSWRWIRGERRGRCSIATKVLYDISKPFCALEKYVSTPAGYGRARSAPRKIFENTRLYDVHRYFFGAFTPVTRTYLFFSQSESIVFDRESAREKSTRATFSKRVGAFQCTTAAAVTT